MRTAAAAAEEVVISPALASPKENRPGQGRLQEKSGHNFGALLEGIFSSSIVQTSFAPGTEGGKSRDDCSSSDDLEFYEGMIPGFIVSAKENKVDLVLPGGEQVVPGIDNGLLLSFHPQYPEIKTGELLQEHEEVPRGFGWNFLQDSIPPKILGQWDDLAPSEKELLRFILTSIADQSLQTGKTIRDNGISGKPGTDLQYSLDEFFPNVGQIREKISIQGLEEQFISGQIPLVDDQGGLSPQAGALIVSMLREGKSLEELPPVILQELDNCISEKSALDDDSSRERPFNALLSRIGGFLRACLGAEREEGEEPFTGPIFLEKGEKEAPGPPNAPPLLPSETGEGSFPLNSTFQDETGVKAPVISSYGQSREYAGLHHREILSRIVDRMDFLARPGEQELHLKLEPEFLGEVLIRVRLMKDRLTGEIITNHIAVKELLEGQLETLRQRFQQMDLNIERFSVFVRDEAHDGSPFERGRQESEAFSWGDGSDSLKEEERVLSSSDPLWGGRQMVDYLV